MVKVVVMGAMVEPAVEGSFLIEPRTPGAGHQTMKNSRDQLEATLPKNTWTQLTTQDCLSALVKMGA